MPPGLPCASLPLPVAQATMEILICMDALEAESLRVLPLGLLARNIQVGLEQYMWVWVLGTCLGGGSGARL